MEELLKKFGVVFLKDPAYGLPILRGIEYQIDLMSKFSTPNRPAYRSNSKETKESQRQVESLMEKGWVRECLSPCAMPIILVNQTLSQLLRCLVGKNLKVGKQSLPHAEFSYNMVVNSITYSPFEVVYSSSPLSLLICYLCLTLLL